MAGGSFWLFFSQNLVFRSVRHYGTYRNRNFKKANEIFKFPFHPILFVYSLPIKGVIRRTAVISNNDIDFEKW